MPTDTFLLQGNVAFHCFFNLLLLDAFCQIQVQLKWVEFEFNLFAFLVVYLSGTFPVILNARTA